MRYQTALIPLADDVSDAAASPYSGIRRSELPRASREPRGWAGKCVPWDSNPEPPD